MLMSPPNPPKPSITKERPVASTIGRSHGSAAIQPKTPRPPRKRPAIYSDVRDAEDRQQRRYGDKAGEQDLDELPAIAMLGIHQQVMHSDGQAVEQQEDEGEAAYRVAVEAPARRAGRHRVKGDVSREQPEIDDGVQRPRKQRPREAGIDGLHETQRRRDDLKQQFG